MRRIRFVLMMVVLALAETAFPDYLVLWGNQPDLLLITAVAAGMMFDLRSALCLGALAGLLKSSMNITPVVLTICLGAGTSALVWWGSRKITLQTPFIRAAAVLVPALLVNCIAGGVQLYLGMRVMPGIFMRIVLIRAVYTALLAPFFIELLELVCPRTRARADFETNPW